MGKQGGLKLRRSTKKKSYYAAHFAVTARNKARRAAKRELARVK